MLNLKKNSKNLRNLKKKCYNKAFFCFDFLIYIKLDFWIKYDYVIHFIMKVS